ncbi:PREDICTED: cornifin-B-like [Pterocles gutturalis]|uniref:cornifin-B-like n=1 Tax=Pterocles gutturalis TaxID=240206 RepID=UPI0005288052|nr:PREDICTED: cornifin-B-like [Pterocles gutturalis]
MAYYGYQYKQQCYIPNGAKCATPVPRQCHNPSAVKSVSYTPCASKGTKLCTVRKTLQSSPKCSTPCLPRCVETRIAEGPSSSCIPRAPAPCTLAFPQPHVQGRGHLCMPHCIQPGITRCPQLCAPAHVYHHSSYPCSYQWSNSYQYNYGPQ